MDVNDAIYLISLVFSICFGCYYRTIRDRNVKKNVGTTIGILLMMIIAKTFIIHLFVTTLVNALIISFIHKRRCHLVSFTFSFLYLTLLRSVMYSVASTPSGPTNLAQMILTLKLVGLAFEINTTYTIRNEKNIEKSEEEQNKAEANCIEPTFLDIFHYAFNYIGILAGPYYRYRTFIDHLNYPFAEHANWKRAIYDTLKCTPFYAIIFCWSSHIWPISYLESSEFSEKSLLYRYWYTWPIWTSFKTRMYLGFLMSTSVCIAGGLGAYPSSTKPRSGQGPTGNFTELKKLAETNLSDADVDYETVRNVNIYEVEFCTSYREVMKNWNLSIQYWLHVNIYKTFPSKKYRTFVTFLVSSLWHGTTPGFYLSIGTLPLVLLLEDVYQKLSLVKETGQFFYVYQWIHWVFKMYFFSLQIVPFVLPSVELTMKYFHSVYHMGPVVGIVMYAVGRYLLAVKESNKKMTTEMETQKLKKL